MLRILILPDIRQPHIGFFFILFSFFQVAEGVKESGLKNKSGSFFILSTYPAEFQMWNDRILRRRISGLSLIIT